MLESPIIHLPHLVNGDTPFSKVAEVFPPKSNSLATYTGEDKNKSLFTAQQHQFIQTTMSYLVLLSEGKTRGEINRSNEIILPMHRDITTFYLGL